MESYHISFWSILSIFEAFFGQLVVVLALWQFPGTLICSRGLKYCSNTKSFTTLLGSSFKWNKVPKYTFLCLVAYRQAMWNDNRVVCFSHLQTPCSSISPPSSCSISCCPVRPFPPLVVLLLHLETGDCDPEVPLSHRSASRASFFRHQNQAIQGHKYHPERSKYLMMQWSNEHILLPWNERNLPEICLLTWCFFLVFFFLRYVSWGD